MKLFIDASISPAVAKELASQGFDAVDQRDVLPANAKDITVLAEAWKDQRLVVARDYDMGELVLRGFAQARGVIIVAFDYLDAEREAERIAFELNQLGERAGDAVHVIEAAGVRTRPYDKS